jgi:hypothetical protein
MTDIVLPKLSQTGTNEWADVEDNDVAIRTVVNGQITNGNLSGSAAITDANLASPNNSVYRKIFHSSGMLGSDANAGTYLLGANASSSSLMLGQTLDITPADGAERAPDIFYFDDADYTVSGLTRKLRLRAQVAANATQPIVTFTFGLYPITVAGTADNLTFTLGTVVSSSTVAIASPAASTVTSGVNSDFTIPADGSYALGVVTNASMTNNSAVAAYAQLQLRHV